MSELQVRKKHAPSKYCFTVVRIPRLGPRPTIMTWKWMIGLSLCSDRPCTVVGCYSWTLEIIRLQLLHFKIMCFAWPLIITNSTSKSFLSHDVTFDEISSWTSNAPRKTNQI